MTDKANLGEMKNQDEMEREKEIEENEEKTTKEEALFDGVPKDRGWSWVICIGVFVTMTSLTGFNRISSVLFVDYMELYQKPASVITFLFTCQSLCSSVATILVSNILMARFTVRRIAVAASLLNCLTTFLISFAPNIYVFLLLFCFKGFAFGALLVGPMSLIGFYFKKRRSLAASIANSGVCVSFIAFPPITNQLRLTFGLQGCLWMVAAIEMHLLVTSLLLRSVESYRALYARSQRDKAKAAAQVSTVTSQTRSDDISGKTTYDFASNKKQNSGQLSKKNGGNSKDDNFDEFEFEEVSYRQRSNSDGKYLESLFDPRAKAPMLAASLGELRHLPTSSSDTLSKAEQVDHYSSHLSIIKDVDLPYLPPGVQSDEGVDQTSLQGTEEQKKKPRCCSLKTIIDTSLFKIWCFRMMVMYYPLATFTNYMLIYLPTMAITVGMDKTDAALLMTISGVMDLVTRIVAGLVADTQFVSKAKMVAFSLVVVIPIAHLYRFFTTYESFLAYAVIMGVFGGFRHNFSQVMLIEYVGVERQAKGFGIVAMLVTLLLSANHPVIGGLLDATGSFTAPMHYVGSVQFVSLCILLCEPFFKKLDKKRESEEAAAEAQRLKGRDPETGKLKD